MGFVASRRRGSSPGIECLMQRRQKRDLLFGYTRCVLRISEFVRVDRREREEMTMRRIESTRNRIHTK